MPYRAASRRLGSATPTLPSQCAICAAWPARLLCDACVQAFAQPGNRCVTCALALQGDLQQCGACVRQPPPLDACHAAVSYAFPWNVCIGQFKFQEAPGMASALALLMRSAPWIEPAIDAASVVVPMPLAAVRLRMRGYNQASLLAKALAPSKCRTDLLLRIRETEAQTRHSRVERLSALTGAFAVEPLRATLLAGASVVIVDDVMTTGASLHAAALALRRAGAARVTGVVLARTE